MTAGFFFYSVQYNAAADFDQDLKRYLHWSLKYIKRPKVIDKVFSEKHLILLWIQHVRLGFQLL
jgi:hypothetical protein